MPCHPGAAAQCQPACCCQAFGVCDPDLPVVPRRLGCALISIGKANPAFASTAAFLALAHRARDRHFHAGTAARGAKPIAAKCNCTPPLPGQIRCSEARRQQARRNDQ